MKWCSFVIFIIADFGLIFWCFSSGAPTLLVLTWSSNHFFAACAEHAQYIFWAPTKHP